MQIGIVCKSQSSLADNGAVDTSSTTVHMDWWLLMRSVAGSLPARDSDKCT